MSVTLFEKNKEETASVECVDELLTDANDEVTRSEEAIGEQEKYQQWRVTSKGVYTAVGKVNLRPKIPSGYYTIIADENGRLYAARKSFMFDEHIDLPIQEFNEILNDIDAFWDRKAKFDEYGFIHKRGILMYGRQGLGKSFLINSIIKKLINEKNGCVFSVYNKTDLRLFHKFFREQFRVIEPNTPVVVILEDIDGLCATKETETELLNLMDGIEHSSSIVYLATTNHIDLLGERIINRPSRFDKRYHITQPNEVIRKVFISEKLKKSDLKNIDLDYWVEKTEGYSIAHIKELIISAILFGKDIDTAIKDIDEMRLRPKVDEEFSDTKERFGFK